ncbi:Ig-like domain-containing protein [Salipiger sp. P9]|uniref:Ig-like domain-containing protein n=1 Tax=Salipiger pentaromativorans TaxID=2943193 RepID=UPI0021578C57|nr:Ig-like domain-containing protein [Salipiger pentaromativorans]MCR8551206.1 Ig-like domain-containing protein [Salipiger pentaromativorans]
MELIAISALLLFGLLLPSSGDDGDDNDGRGTGDDGAPEAADDTATTEAGTATLIDILGNDTDPDGDMLIVDRLGDPENGSIELTEDGLLYQPNADFVGTDTFDYRVSDGNGGSDTATVTVNVTESDINGDPEAAPDIASTGVDEALIIEVLSNDTDTDGDPLVVESAGPAGNGTVEVLTDGTVLYTPNTGYSGSDSFSYTVSDGQGGTDVETVTVTVGTGGPNVGPIANDDSLMLAETLPQSINVLANDTDPDGDPLTVQSVGEAAQGTTALAENGTITYTPADNFHGTDSFSYTVVDTQGETATANVEVDINLATDLSDNLVLGDGDNMVDALNGNDTVAGQGGNDTIFAGVGYDEVTGGDGDDFLDGSSNLAFTLDVVNGEISDAALRLILAEAEVTEEFADVVDDFADTVDGGPGNDTLLAAEGDILTGGEGSDDFLLGAYDLGENNSQQITITDFVPGEDQILLVEYLGAEEIVIESQSYDPETNTTTVQLSSDGNQINLVLEGLDQPLTEDDIAHLNPLNMQEQSITGGTLENVTTEIPLTQTEGEIALTDFPDDVINNGTPEVIRLGGGDDILVNFGDRAPYDATHILAGDGDDMITDFGGSHIFAEDGNDTISSTATTLTLDGGEGDDRLEFHAGQTVVGGAGSDVFSYQGRDGDADVEIADFTSEDQIELPGGAYAVAMQTPTEFGLRIDLMRTEPGETGTLTILLQEFEGLLTPDNFVGPPEVGAPVTFLNTADGTPVS